MSLVPASVESPAMVPFALPHRLVAAGLTDRGRVRSSNQDCFRVDAELGLLLVADGMGGHAGGDVAAHMAAATLIECLKAPVPSWPFGCDPALSDTANRLRTGFQSAHLRLLEASLLDPSLSGMGTTLVVAVEHEGLVTVAWAGDSRLYVLDEEGLRQVTRDDSWLEAALEEMSAAGVDDEDELEALQRHPLRHALTNVVGTTVPTDVHIVDVPVSPGMVVLLTTDGVHGALGPERLAEILAERAEPRDAAAALVAAALAAGSTDNCTAVIGRFSR